MTEGALHGVPDLVQNSFLSWTQCDVFCKIPYVVFTSIDKSNC